MADVIEYQWTVIHRDVAAYLNGGRDEELKHLALFAPRYGIPVEVIRTLWSKTREARNQQQAKRGGGK